MSFAVRMRKLGSAPKLKAWKQPSKQDIALGLIEANYQNDLQAQSPCS